MPGPVANKIYRTFVKGLITEASPLTYPENASIDEDNCILYRKGNRSRRPGIDFESGYQFSPYSIPQASPNDNALWEYKWEAVNSISTLNFLVHQVGLTLYFYDLAESTVSPNLLPFTVDLTPYIVPGTANPQKQAVEMAGGRGFLFVVSPIMEPILVTYDPTHAICTSQQINITIRDFVGVNDGLANDQEPTTLTAEHNYNLQNQGWVDPSNDGSKNLQVVTVGSWGDIKFYTPATTTVIDQYYTQFKRYPPNNKQWWIAKYSANQGSHKQGDFDPQLAAKFYFGNNHAPRGHFVVNPFNIDRSGVSGISGLPIVSTNERPSSVAFYSGRVWYAQGCNLYASQIIDDVTNVINKCGACMQVADPTSEDLSDLVASDGMFLPIPEATKVVRLYTLGAGLAVFATNGVWYISGTALSGFSATDFAVIKLSPLGTDLPHSIVENENQIFWWSQVGIMTMQQGSGGYGFVTPTMFQKVNLTLTTIQTLYNELYNQSGGFVRGMFDPGTNTIQWLIKSNSSLPDNFYDRILIYDLTLGAFYPYTITSQTGFPYICGLFLTPRLSEVFDLEDVTVSGVDVTASSVQVTTDTPDLQIRPTFLYYLFAVPQSDGNLHFTLGNFSNENFVDWQSMDGTGLAYLSFIETGYELLDDSMRKKQATYIFKYFRRTEDEYVLDTDGGYSLRNPSSCLFTTKWEWSSSEIANKWSTQIEAYRITKRPQFSTSDLTFDTGYPIVVTKDKVRGTGRAIQFRFENSKIGYNFDLLGWAASYTGTTIT